MRYRSVIPATFLSRPNRFVAQVEMDGEIHTVHVKNTGRCRELLIPGAAVWLSEGDGTNRKTKYDLITVEKEICGEKTLVNIDSQVPNSAVAEWLRGGLFSANAKIRREMTYGASRFDFYIEDGERRIFAEVKGVTLEKEGRALFPDAPTERGVKHIRHLISCMDEGYEAYIIFVIQMKGVTSFSPNDEMHRQFGDALRDAADAGVKIVAVDCLVTPDTMTINSPVTVEL